MSKDVVKQYVANQRTTKSKAGKPKQKGKRYSSPGW